jgi:hypothetical protein
MGFQTLYRAKAFSAGSDLWVMPEPDESDLATKIDWYLNFQIAKAKVHKAQENSAPLSQIIDKHALRLPPAPTTHNLPLMIASEHHFPNRMVVEIKVAQGATTWVQSIQRLWGQLDRPKLRVFLPRSLTPEQFQKAWATELAPSDEISLVPPT